MEQEKKITKKRPVHRTFRIDLVASPEDQANLRQVAAKLGTKKVTETIFQSVEQVANSSPDLFFCNRVAIRDTDLNIFKGLELLQNLIDELKKVLPGLMVTIDEIRGWFSKGRAMMVANPEAIREFLIDKLFQAQQSRYPGLKFSRENIELPDLSALFEAASQLISISEINMKEVGVLWNCYTITESKVTVITGKLEEFKSQFRAAAETVEERQRLSKVRVLCESLTAFSKDIPDPARLNIRSVCYFDEESARFEPSEFYVKFSLK